MKKLRVLFEGWGERWALGTLAQTDRDTLFEYSPEAIARGLALSPLRQPLPKPGAASMAYPGHPSFANLPGFIADALPDGWGLLLMDRALRQRGRDPRAVSVLERLAIIGHRAMGALSFEPADEDLLPSEALELNRLARDVADLQTQEFAATETAQAQLRRLMLLGGSPQGARPKVLVDFNPDTGHLSSGQTLEAGDTPWLIKFPAQGEHREVCALEDWYASVAQLGGMDMPRHQFFDLDTPHSAFGVERFDRLTPAPGEPAQRVPVLSLSAYLQADHRLPSLDYETVLLATLRITGDRRELLKAFERCVFNVLKHNRDDHAKNFAFRMEPSGRWKLSPAFDLTHSFGPGGEHSTSVAGHGKAITRQHLLQVAERAGLDAALAQERITHWCETIHTAAQQPPSEAIRPTTWNDWQGGLQERLALLKQT